MDATSRLFDIETARTELILRGHRRSARPGFVTADGRQVVSASDDGTIRWWWLRHEDIVQAADALAVRLGLGELTAGEQARIPDLDGR
jgi:WD40 repeat protein